MIELERTAHRRVGRWFAAVTCVGLLAACGPEAAEASTDGGEGPPGASLLAPSPHRICKPPEWAPVLVAVPAAPRPDHASGPGYPPEWEPGLANSPR